MMAVAARRRTAGRPGSKAAVQVQAPRARQTNMYGETQALHQPRANNNQQNSHRSLSLFPLRFLALAPPLLLLLGSSKPGILLPVNFGISFIDGTGGQLTFLDFYYLLLGLYSCQHSSPKFRFNKKKIIGLLCQTF
jgi:hypothetical protein